MSNGDRTRIPVRHMSSGQFAVGDDRGGPDDNAPDMEQVAPGWYRPAPPAPYAIHNRARRDVVPPSPLYARPDEGDSCRVAPEVHAVPTVTRRQRVTPADPGMESMARAILDSIRVSVAASGPIPNGADERAVHLGAAIEAGVRNGVMVVGEEIDRLRGMIGDCAKVAEQIAAAPGMTDTAGIALLALVQAMRAGLAVGK